MKMTDVITGLREMNPKFQEAFGMLSIEIEKLSELARDNDLSSTLEGRKALGSALALQAMIVKSAYYGIRENVKELDDIVRSYTRRLASEGQGEAADGVPVQAELDLSVPEDDGSRDDSPGVEDCVCVCAAEPDDCLPEPTKM